MLLKNKGGMRLVEAARTACHLSARPQGKDHSFLLPRFGQLFDEITASSLIAVGLEGHAIEKFDEARINNAGFTIHSAVHMARDDAQCIMHSHTTAGMAVTAQEQGPLPPKLGVDAVLRPHQLPRLTKASRSTPTSASGWCATSATTTP